MCVMIIIMILPFIMMLRTDNDLNFLIEAKVRELTDRYRGTRKRRM